MFRKVTILVIIIAIFFAVPLIAGNSEKEKAAILSAEKWLAFVDAQKYPESWNEAGEFFKNAVSQEQWVQSLQAVRKPLGKLITRKVRTKTYRTSLPGAPDGEYVVIEFETSFAQKKTAIETVTPMIDKDGTWRVSGYYIK
jgi:hypothetical protein